VIDHPAFTVEPWALCERELSLSLLARSGSIFALGNGHIGLRGNLDEGEPNGIPGSYLNGFYETRPLPYAEAGYGFPEAGQTMVNVTNGKIIRLQVDDEPFDVRSGECRSHERTLDFRAGVLRRRVEWVSPAGQAIRVSSVRLVSFVQRAIAAVCYEVEPLGSAARLVVQSELIANEPLPPAPNEVPVGADSAPSLRSEQCSSLGSRVVLVHSTRSSGLRMAAGMDHVVEGPPGTNVRTTEQLDDLGRVTITAHAEPGQRLRVIKFFAYGWSSQRGTAALRDQVAAAIAAAHATGWTGLVSAQRRYLDEFWERADVELEGDAELQQAVRFGLFHALQASARSEGRAIASRGLTGPGNHGHAFWDTETFVLPLLTYTVPSAARDALRWRHSTLGLARERARLFGLGGALFPSRTIAGEECSGYWPAGTAAFHVAADIAQAVGRYQAATEDATFERDIGLELLIETARLWRSLGHHASDGQFRIDGVTGPDEYSAIADNNVYTNLMAQGNLQLAADAAERHRGRAAALGVDAEEAAAWRDAASAIYIPYDERLGIHPQADGFTEHQVWDFAGTAPHQYPLIKHAPHFDLYRKQVVKQADLVLALHLRGDAFSDEAKARNFAYYEALTVRDSALSACTQAVIAAEVGHVELAYDYFCEAALIDLDNLEHNTHDGLHIASLAGAWTVAVAGFGGMRDHNGALTFAPRLPQRLNRICFGLCVRGRRLRIDIQPHEAEYSLRDGAPLEFTHHGTALRVSAGKPVTRPIPPPPLRDEPRQPTGRTPRRRRPPTFAKRTLHQSVNGR
jgi:alpha,alpha-trehalose phosphorylase